jgi:hypothetical protein
MVVVCKSKNTGSAEGRRVGELWQEGVVPVVIRHASLRNRITRQ